MFTWNKILPDLLPAKNKLFKFFVTILPNLWGLRSSRFNVKSLITSIFQNSSIKPSPWSASSKSCSCTKINLGLRGNKGLKSPCLHITPSNLSKSAKVKCDQNGPENISGLIDVGLKNQTGRADHFNLCTLWTLLENCVHAHNFSLGSKINIFTHWKHWECCPHYSLFKGLYVRLLCSIARWLKGCISQVLFSEAVVTSLSEWSMVVSLKSDTQSVTKKYWAVWRQPNTFCHKEGRNYVI